MAFYQLIKMLAINLVNSMKIEVVAKDKELEKMLGIKPISYKEALQLAFQRIEQNNLVSSWKDSLVSSYSVLPFHYFVFDGMAENIIKFKRNI